MSSQRIAESAKRTRPPGKVRLVDFDYPPTGVRAGWWYSAGIRASAIYAAVKVLTQLIMLCLAMTTPWVIFRQFMTAPPRIATERRPPKKQMK